MGCGNLTIDWHPQKNADFLRCRGQLVCTRLGPAGGPRARAEAMGHPARPGGAKAARQDGEKLSPGGRSASSSKGPVGALVVQSGGDLPRECP